MKKFNKDIKILCLDIETSPLITYTFGLFDQNIGLNQVIKDTHLLAFSAKWYESKDGEVFGPHNRVIYFDQRNEKNIEDDRKILREVWKLLDAADIVLTQNGRSFDIKFLNSRFIIQQIPPPSSFKQLDTLRISKKTFRFTSNKLEWMTDKINKKFKKLKHKKFPGMELWTECMAGNKEAWDEMKTYNIHDVLSTEELYQNFQPWDNSIDFNLYRDTGDITCNCGSTRIIKNGYHYSANGRFQRYRCGNCNAEIHGRNNLFSSERKVQLRK